MPIFSTNPSSINPVGPVKNIVIKKKPHKIMLNCESLFIPAFKPKTTLMSPSIVMKIIIQNVPMSVELAMPTYSSPVLIWVAPNPNDVAIPKRSLE